VNRDRRSLALDPTTPAGRAVVARLVEAADVVVENFLLSAWTTSS
jgi:crotonobetainyl-CoA:carnitine CoA-transferase CaiB-like acyl-CoA transferase